MSPRAALLLSALIVAACSADGTEGDDLTASDGAGTSTSTGAQAGGGTNVGAGGSGGIDPSASVSTSSSTSASSSTSSTGGAPPMSVCGDGVLQAGETCDDGVITSHCDTWHDGGDGTCVAPGTCSTGFVLASGVCVPEVATASVTIFVDNFCAMTVTPTSFTVAPGQRLQLSYHNTSAYYPVDIWKSYGGGYLDLPTGATWNETYEHCGGPNAYTEWADISTACSMFTLTINCQ